MINIYEPTFHDRMRLFDHYLRQQGMVLSVPELKLFAAQTHMCSPAAIRKVINSAHASGQALTRELIQSQILETIFKIVPGFELLQGKEQREIAVYQSGKLLVHVLNALEYSPTASQAFLSGERFALCTAAAIEKAPQELAAFVVDAVAKNINFDKGARRTFGKMFVYRGREDAHGMRMRLREKEFMISELLAGACAQEIFLKDVVDDMQRDDYRLAFEYCLDIECHGLPLSAMSKADEQNCRKAAFARFVAAQERTRALLNKHATVCKKMISFMLKFKEFPHITALHVLMLLDEAQDKQADKEVAVPHQETPGEALPGSVVLA